MTVNRLSIYKIGWIGGSWLINLRDEYDGSEEYSAATSLAHAKKHALRLYNSYTGEKRKRLPWVRKAETYFICEMEQK